MHADSKQQRLAIWQFNLLRVCNCLAQLKHYRSLMPLAQEARKPMFLLTPADGALGGHFQAAQACRRSNSARTASMRAVPEASHSAWLTSSASRCSLGMAAGSGNDAGDGRPGEG